MKKWFANLKVSQKLMLISIFFVMPDSLMLYFFITGINANIQFARLEKKGNEYQRPLEDLLELIPQHHMLVQAGNAQELEYREQLAKKQAQIDGAFSALGAVDARLGTDLQFTDGGLAKRHREHYRPRTVRAEWEELKMGLSKLQPEACAEQHLHLVADIRMMITHAGDLSNLILDPDLDSYYLMDVTLLALPQTQDRLAAVLAFGESILKRHAISHLEQQQLAIHAMMLKEADLDRVIGSLQTALNEDANFYGSSATLQSRVPPAFKEYTEATRRFIDLTTRLSAAESLSVTGEEYLAAGTRARDASFKLWKIADEEVDTLLQKRIEYYEQRRARSLMVAALAFLAAVGFVTFITRSISGPLRKQAAELQTANECLQAEIAERKRSEEELKTVHKLLVDTSRQAGMAEVATGVLHNVGNVLNSMNVSASIAHDILRRSKTASLVRTAHLLQERGADLGSFLTTDPQGRLVPGFIIKLAHLLEGENQELLKETSLLSENVEHIKEIIAMQQTYARVSGVVETVQVSELVEDALRMNTGALARHGVETIREFADVPPISVEKHKVLQILVNLIRNAKYACDESGRPDKRMVLRSSLDNGRVRISVVDNGVGIPPENLTRIFGHGFTTRKDGHGFGLHSAANAAREMGGQLAVHSDGPGRGASFTLELPTVLRS